MSKDKSEKPTASRPYGNYIHAELDAESGLYRGVITSSTGEDQPETVLHTCTSLFRDERDALADAVSYCAHRGYQCNVV